MVEFKHPFGEALLIDMSNDRFNLFGRAHLFLYLHTGKVVALFKQADVQQTGSMPKEGCRAGVWRFIEKI